MSSNFFIKWRSFNNFRLWNKIYGKFLQICYRNDREHNWHNFDEIYFKFMLLFDFSALKVLGKIRNFQNYGLRIWKKYNNQLNLRNFVSGWEFLMLETVGHSKVWRQTRVDMFEKLPFTFTHYMFLNYATNCIICVSRLFLDFSSI